MNDSNDRTRLRLIEMVCGAWRGRSRAGEVLSHPAWHDLNDQDRLDAFDETIIQRQLESAIDPQGLSVTARLVLQRLQQRDA